MCSPVCQSDQQRMWDMTCLVTCFQLISIVHNTSVMEKGWQVSRLLCSMSRLAAWDQYMKSLHIKLVRANQLQAYVFSHIHLWLTRIFCRLLLLLVLCESHGDEFDEDWFVSEVATVPTPTQAAVPLLITPPGERIRSTSCDYFDTI